MSQREGAKCMDADDQSKLTLSPVNLEKHLRHAGLLPAPTTHVTQRL